MANISFTKDEAILALDTLLFSSGEHFSPTSTAVLELSQLLNELPIHPMAKRMSNFRNPYGVSQQIRNFGRAKKIGVKDLHIGSVFFAVYDENRYCLEKIHDIAEAIRNNKEFFQNHLFGDELENDNFPEGALLYHLHNLLERRDSKNVMPEKRCSICQLNLAEVYKPITDSFMQLHLLVPVTELDYKTKYKPKDFVTVCPNCHTVLHKYRPWATKETASDILG